MYLYPLCACTRLNELYLYMYFFMYSDKGTVSSCTSYCTLIKILYLYSEASLPSTVCISTPYISRFFALFKYPSSAWAGLNPLNN